MFCKRVKLGKKLLLKINMKPSYKRGGGTGTMPRQRTRFQSAVPNPASICLKDEKSVSYRCIRPLLVGRGLCYSLEKG